MRKPWLRTFQLKRLQVVLHFAGCPDEVTSTTHRRTIRMQSGNFPTATLRCFGSPVTITDYLWLSPKKPLNFCSFEVPSSCSKLQSRWNPAAVKPVPGHVVAGRGAWGHQSGWFSSCPRPSQFKTCTKSQDKASQWWPIRVHR